jgi:hypothetical protein
MRLIHFVCLLALSTPVFAADLIGSEIPPYPDGLKEAEGACVADSLGADNICNYAIGVLANANDEPTHIYAGKFLRYDKENAPYWLVTDAIPYPKLPDDYFVAFATCRENGKDDSTIFAAVKGEDTEIYKNILWAYRLDLTQQKFITLDTKGVDCRSEGED